LPDSCWTASRDYAALLQQIGQLDNAVRTFSAAAAAREVLKLARSTRRDADSQASLQAARAGLGGAASDAAWSTGQTWTLDEAVERSLASGTI